MKLKIKLDPGAYMPERAHSTDAGLDLRSIENVHIFPYCEDNQYWTEIETGVHVQFPPGYYGKIEGRSGLARKYGLLTFGGVIDSGYTGAIKVLLMNLGDEPILIKSGDKIAQLIIQRCETPDLEFVSRLDDTERGNNGFGSTGW